MKRLISHWRRDVRKIGEPGEEAEVFDALLKGEKVVVEDSERFGELEQVGYGEREGKKLVLKDYEALYLLFSGRLKPEGRRRQGGRPSTSWPRSSQARPGTPGRSSSSTGT